MANCVLLTLLCDFMKVYDDSIRYLLNCPTNKKDRYADAGGVIVFMLIPILSYAAFQILEPGFFQPSTNKFYLAVTLHLISQLSIAYHLYISLTVPKYVRFALLISSGFANMWFLLEVLDAYAVSIT